MPIFVRLLEVGMVVGGGGGGKDFLEDLCLILGYEMHQFWE
jgi:hypothetical protein